MYFQTFSLHIKTITRLFKSIFFFCGCKSQGNEIPPDQLKITIVNSHFVSRLFISADDNFVEAHKLLNLKRSTINLINLIMIFKRSKLF